MPLYKQPTHTVRSVPDQAETGARFGGGGGGVRARHFTRPLASRGLVVCAGRQAVGAGDVASMTRLPFGQRCIDVLGVHLGGHSGERGAYTHTRTVGQIDR